MLQQVVEEFDVIALLGVKNMTNTILTRGALPR